MQIQNLIGRIRKWNSAYTNINEKEYCKIGVLDIACDVNSWPLALFLVYRFFGVEVTRVIYISIAVNYL